jgi:hypothetical protein
MTCPLSYAIFISARLMRSSAAGSAVVDGEGRRAPGDVVIPVSHLLFVAYVGPGEPGWRLGLTA